MEKESKWTEDRGDRDQGQNEAIKGSERRLRPGRTEDFGILSAQSDGTPVSLHYSLCDGVRAKDEGRHIYGI